MPQNLPDSNFILNSIGNLNSLTSQFFSFLFWIELVEPYFYYWKWSQRKKSKLMKTEFKNLRYFYDGKILFKFMARFLDNSKLSGLHRRKCSYLGFTIEYGCDWPEQVPTCFHVSKEGIEKFIFNFCEKRCNILRMILKVGHMLSHLIHYRFFSN